MFSNREWWGVVTLDEAFDQRASHLCNSALDCVVHIDRLRGGFFDAGILEGRRTSRHLYQVQWDLVSLGVGAYETTLTLCAPRLLQLQRAAGERAGFGRVGAVILVMPQAAGALPMLTTTLSLVQGGDRVGMHVVTGGANLSQPAGMATPSHAGLWGLLRSGRSEEPRLQLRCLDVGAMSLRLRADSCALAAACLGYCGEPEVSARVHGGHHVVRLVVARRSVWRSMRSRMAPLRPSTELLTGGVQGLGLFTAAWLAQLQTRLHLVLASRRGYLSGDASEHLRGISTAKVHVRLCNVAQCIEASSMLAVLQQSLPHVRGVWHAAVQNANGLGCNKCFTHVAPAHNGICPGR